jgi:hypothetical protein
MPIRPSAGAEIRQLIEALGGADEVTRESAVARLAVIGARAVDHLLEEFPKADDAARAGILRALEALGDPRALPVARAALQDRSAPVQAAAIAAVRPFLSSSRSDVARDALDALMAVALDAQRAAPARIAAVDALRDLPADVGEPLRATLAADRDPAVRARAAALAGADAGTPRPGGPSPDDAIWREAQEGRFTAPPEALRRVLARRRGSAPLTELQRLVDRLRAHEQRQTDAGDREAWRAVRGAVHQALAARNSRLALYDLRDSLLDADRLPVAFLASLEEIGDASCLETLAAAYDGSSRSGDAWWREHVATAFRAIVHREGLTRRHAAVKRAMARWPEAAADLMARV